MDVNEVHVEQIMKNLLSNADKYAPHDTTVRITGRIDAGEVIVSVEDAGAGVEADELEVVFDPFFRSAAMAHRAGIGIGLTVCRRLAEAMGGRIWAERGESGGARFSFSLPLVAEPATERS